MDNFEYMANESSEDTDENDQLFQFIFHRKEVPLPSVKLEKNEYRIKVATDLKDTGGTISPLLNLAYRSWEGGPGSEKAALEEAK